MPNRWPLKKTLVLALTTAVLIVGRPSFADPKPAQAKPAAAASTPATPSTSTAPAPTPADPIPDYGGRDVIGNANTAGGADAPSSPLSQAWRAFQALVIVLAVVVGVLFFLKKYGLIKEGAYPGPLTPNNGGTGRQPGLRGLLLTGWQNFLRAGTRPASTVDGAASLSVLSSTTLPGPTAASVHVVEVAGRRYLVGATGGGMTLLADWDSEPAADVDEPVLPNDDERFENYLNRMGMTNETPTEVVGERVSQTTDRLQALLARNREEGEE